MNEKNINLWEQVGNGCLQKADLLLKKDIIPTVETVEMICRLVSAAIEIDTLNLRWEGWSE